MKLQEHSVQCEAQLLIIPYIGKQYLDKHPVQCEAQIAYPSLHRETVSK